MILFITSKNPVHTPKLSGGLQLSFVNYKILEELQTVELFSVYPDKESSTGKIRRLLSLFLGVTHNLTRKVREEIIRKAKNYNTIFIDYSQYGQVAQDLKLRYSSKKIITHFHNIEFEYALSASSLFFPFNILQSLLVRRTEKKACQYSDSLIFLSSRDAAYYAEAQKKSVVCPPAMPDMGKKNLKKSEGKIRILFCGSYFKPNVSGILWFCSEVFPYISAHLSIVGFGMEKLKKQIRNQDVNIIGTVENVAPYYQQSDIVIAPIFKGSGMKIKSIEALMFDKPLVGTTEALVGIPVDSHKIISADAPDEYIRAIKKLAELKNKNALPSTRDIYLNQFTPMKRKEIFKRVLEY